MTLALKQLLSIKTLHFLKATQKGCPKVTLKVTFGQPLSEGEY